MNNANGFTKTQIENAISHYEGVLLRCPKKAQAFYRGLIAELTARL